MAQTNPRPTGRGNCYTHHDLLVALDRAEYLKGARLTSRDADRGLYGLPAVASFARVFGSWRLALTAAGCLVDMARGGRRA